LLNKNCFIDNVSNIETNSANLSKLDTSRSRKVNGNFLPKPVLQRTSFDRL